MRSKGWRWMRAGTNSSRETTRYSSTSRTPSTAGPRSIDHAEDGPAGGGGAHGVLVGGAEEDAPLIVLPEGDLALEVRRRGAQVVVEVRVQPLLEERADHAREEQEDHEGQPSRHRRELERHRQAAPHAVLRL